MFKKLAIVLVALFAFGGTVSAYAWWDQLQVTDSSQTLTIGEGANLSVQATFAPDSGKTLVPNTVMLGANDVTSYDIEYTLVLDKQLAADANLSAVVDSIDVGGNGNPENVISVAVSYDDALQGINADNDIVVTLTVTMIEPSQTAYAQVADQVITIGVTFTAN